MTEPYINSEDIEDIEQYFNTANEPTIPWKKLKEELENK